MLSVIVLGFQMEDVVNIPDIAWAIPDTSASSGLSGREHALIIDKMVDQADVILVNLQRPGFSCTDVVLMHQAFKQQKFILGVGIQACEPLMESFISQQIQELNIAVEHMQTHYKLISQS